MKKILLAALCLMSVPAFANQCYVHESGETCLEETPKRIVVLEYSFIDHLGVLGEVPVGFAKDSMPEYLNPIVADSQEVGARKAPSLESIAALKPDLIIADKKRHTALYDQLSAIAPTIVHNSLRGNYQEQIDSLQQIAEIVGKTEQANRAVIDLEERISESKNSANANSVIIGVFRPGALSVHSNQSFMGSFITRIGKEVPLQVRDGQTQYVLDIEGLAAVNPDAIVMMCSESSQKSFDELVKHPVFSVLKAVKNNNLYVVGKNLWSKGRGVLGLNQVIDKSMSNGLLLNTVTQSLTCVD